MVKIGFTGAHSSGKSALAQALIDDIKDCKSVGSIARLCPLGINKEADLYSQSWIATTRIQKEIENSNTGKPLICERTVLDDYSYLMSIADKACALPNSDLIKSGNKTYQYDEFQSLVKFNTYLTKNWMATYDYVFYLQPLPFIENDGVRPVSKAFQIEIDDMIKDSLEEFGINYVTLPPKSIKERLMIVKNEIKM